MQPDCIIKNAIFKTNKRKHLENLFIYDNYMKIFMGLSFHSQINRIGFMKFLPHLLKFLQHTSTIMWVCV